MGWTGDVEQAAVRYFQGVVEHQERRASDVQLSSEVRDGHAVLRDLAQGVVDAIVPEQAAAAPPADQPSAEPVPAATGETPPPAG